MANVGGVFLVLAIGCSCAIFIGILEFLWNVRKVAIDQKVSLIFVKINQQLKNIYF